MVEDEIKLPTTYVISQMKKEDLPLTLPEKVSFNYRKFGVDDCMLVTYEQKADYLYTALLSFYDDTKSDKWGKYIRFIFNTLVENGVECEFNGETTMKIRCRCDINPPEIYFYNPQYKFYYFRGGFDTLSVCDTLCTNENLLLFFLFSPYVIRRGDNDFNLNIKCQQGKAYIYNIRDFSAIRDSGCYEDLSVYLKKEDKDDSN